MDKRALILDAAIALLGEEGLGSFSQPRLAARMDMRQGHITYYFPTRSDLLQAVSVRALAQRADTLRAILTAPDSAAGIAQFARVLADPAQTRVLIALTQTADLDPGVRAASADFASELAPTSAAFLTSVGITPNSQNLPLLQSVATGISVLMLALAPEDAEMRAGQLISTLLNALRDAQPAGDGMAP